MAQPQTAIIVSYSLLNYDVEAFNKATELAIDDILSALGETNKLAVYRHLKTNYGISKKEIPHKIEDFAKAIEVTFGSAAKIIEIKIMERLHAKYSDFSYVSKEGNLDFVEFFYNLQHYASLKA